MAVKHCQVDDSAFLSIPYSDRSGFLVTGFIKTKQTVLSKKTKEKNTKY